jgi:hypothetical protein
VRGAPLDGDERGQQGGAADQEGERDGIAPAVGLRSRQAEHESEQARRHGQRAGNVERRPRGHGDVPQEASARNRGGDREEDRHVQAPAPVEHLGERAAEQQADGAAHAGDPGVDPERLAALGGVGERRGQQRQRGGCEQRAEGTLQRPGRHEHAEALRGAAQRRGAGEPEQAADERPLTAEQVGDAAAEEQQAAERQRVRGDHPLAVVVGEAELPLAPRAGRCSRWSRRARPSAGRFRSRRGSASGGRGGCVARSAPFGHIGWIRSVTAMTNRDQGT